MVPRRVVLGGLLGTSTAVVSSSVPLDLLILSWLVASAGERREGGRRVNTAHRRGRGTKDLLLLTAVNGASPADPADGPAWSVGVRGGGGDQVVVHVAVQTRLLSRGLLLHLSGEPGGEGGRGGGTRYQY